MIIFETLFCEPFAKFTEYAQLLDDLWLKCSTNNKPIISMTMKNSRLSMRGLCNCRVDMRQNWFLKLFFLWIPFHDELIWKKRTLSSSRCKSETVKWIWTTYSNSLDSVKLTVIQNKSRKSLLPHEIEWNRMIIVIILISNPRQDVLMNGCVFLTDNSGTFWCLSKVIQSENNIGNTSYAWVVVLFYNSFHGQSK